MLTFTDPTNAAWSDHTWIEPIAENWDANSWYTESTAYDSQSNWSEDQSAWSEDQSANWQPEAEQLGGLELNMFQNGYSSSSASGSAAPTLTQEDTNKKILESVSKIERELAAIQTKTVRIGIDSGASVSVAPEDFGLDYPLEDIPAPGSKQYRTANGSLVDDQGKRKVQLRGKGTGKLAVWKARIAKVHKPLMAISELVDAGNDVYFTREGAWSRNRNSGEITWFTRTKGIYEYEAELIPFGKQVKEYRNQRRGKSWSPPRGNWWQGRTW